MQGKPNRLARLSQHAAVDIIDLIAYSAYFWIIFAALILFKATTLRLYGVHYIVWGSAIVKAVVLAKFMMVGRSIKFRAAAPLTPPLLKAVATKTATVFVVILALTGLEQVSAALLRHQPLAALLAEAAGPKRGEAISETVILLIVVVPLATLDVLSGFLGPGTMVRIMFNKDIPEDSIRRKPR